MNAAIVNRSRVLGLVLAALAGSMPGLVRAADAPAANCRFLGIEDFSGFSRTLSSTGDVVLLSPVITTDLEWDELVVSWNARLAPGVSLRVEARACHPEQATRFYAVGLWSLDAAALPRASVTGQRDDDGDVQTDTLVLTRPATSVQVRLIFEGLTSGAGCGTPERGARGRRGRSRSAFCIPHSAFQTDHSLVTAAATSTRSAASRVTRGQGSELAFVGLSFLNTRVVQSLDNLPKVEPVEPLSVPQRSQLAYEHGAAWCSPTAVSMILGYWAERCGRPEWDRAVPDVAAGVFDPNWPGTGNWPFNTAYAGALPGMRGYVTRMADLAELASWLRSGVPVAASVSYSVLQGQSHNGSGHFVVCAGITESGDVVVNDPGTRHEIRRTFPPADFLRAWAYSHQTAYVIHPKEWSAPRPTAPLR